MAPTPLRACTASSSRPSRRSWTTKADFVALPLYDGEIGIAPGHSPLIGRLGYGEMRIKPGGRRSRYYVDGGFVQVPTTWSRS